MCSSPRGRIPARLVVPIVRQYLDGFETFSLESPGQESGATPGHNFPRAAISPMGILADEAGLKRDTLQRILAGRSGTVEFETADRLLCAMDLTHLWFREPLRSHYYHASLPAVAA